MILAGGRGGLKVDEDGDSSSSELLDEDNGEGDASKKMTENWKRERSLELGFQPQKEIIYNKLLPYAAHVDEDATKWFQDIKANLGRALALRELRPGIVVWVSRLHKYIRLYGLRFPAKDHVSLVHLLYSLLTVPDLEPFMITHVSATFCALLKKRELLTSEQVQLAWRPLYLLYERTLHSHREALGLIKLPPNIDHTLRIIIKHCRPYFPVEATREMLTEWRPLMCPLDVTMGKAITYLKMFLPTFKVAASHPQDTFNLWLEELLGFWAACGNSSIWEPSLMALLGRLAEDTQGIVDWDEHLALVFTRVQKMFSLPVYYNKTNVGHKGQGLDCTTATRFIVATLGGGSKTQTYLGKLLASLESYYHPANMGKYSLKLTEFMSKLTGCFVKRVHKERNNKPSWGFTPAAENLLSEDDITSFVLSLKPIVLNAMWSKWGFLDAGATLQALSSLRPALILPVLVSRLYSALDSVTEPHKLTASLYSVAGVARGLVTHHQEYQEGRTHVLPLLFSVLPGIDTNDLRKSMITFQFISTFASLIPFVDNSAYVDCHDNLTEEERQICSQSAQFEDFIVEFLNRCFAIVENSEVHQIRSEVSTDDASVSREDTMKDVGMASTFSAVLMQCSHQLYDVALKKVRSWVQGRIMEWKISGKIAAGLCRCLTKVRPERGLAGLMPVILDSVEASLGEEGEVGQEEHLGDGLKFQLMVLSEMVKVPGRFLGPYVARLTRVLKDLSHHSSREGDILTGSVLRHTLRSLTQLCPVEYKSSPDGYDLDLSTYLPLKDWGRAGDIHNLQVEWYIPGEEEVSLAQGLVENLLGAQLTRLEDFRCGRISLSRHSLVSSLSLVSALVLGAGSLLPTWTSPQVHLRDSVTEHSAQGVSQHIVWPGEQPELTLQGQNVRGRIVTVLHSLLEHLLTQCPDHAKVLTEVAGLYQSLLLFSGVPRVEYDQRLKGFVAVKKAMENKLLGSKKHIRAILIDRTQLQHEGRLIENASRTFTELHKLVYSDLLTLSTNHYSEVRVKGQEVLGKGIKFFSYSYELVVPRLLELIKKSEDVSHEQFKGALYVILGSKGKSLLTKHHWPTFAKLCPAVVSASHSEKPSIISVFNGLLESVVHHLDTITIKFHLPDQLVDEALGLWTEGEEVDGIKTTIQPSTSSVPSEVEIRKGLEENERMNQETLDSYLSIINTLCDQLESGLLHWRHYNAGISILATLTRFDVMLPARAVRIMVSNLVHDNLVVRKTSIHAMAALLKQNKRLHPKMERKVEVLAGQMVQPGNRSDNEWLQYKEENRPTNKEEWNRPNFVQKTHFGYYHWPQPLLVYKGEEEQPKLDREEQEMGEEEREIFRFLRNEKNLEKLITFLSLEENKGRDKFDSRKFLMWKGVFRNHGPDVLERLKTHVERLVDDQGESKQRAAAELIAGLIRGSKHWGWENTSQLWAWLVPVLRGMLGKVTVETIGDWGTCFATASESRDPNRIFWMLEVLMEEPLRSQGSFLDSSRLYVLQGAVAQQEWRVGSLLHRLDTFLRPYLTHPYQNVRERLGSVVTNIYAFDITFPTGSAGSSSPALADLVEEVLPKLDMMLTEPDPELYNFHKNKEKSAQEITPEIFDTVCSKMPPELGDRIRQQGIETLQSLVSALPGGKIPPTGLVPQAALMNMPSPEMMANMRMPSPEMMANMRMPSPEMMANMRMPSPEIMAKMRMPSPEMMSNMRMPSPGMMSNMRMPSPEMMANMKRMIQPQGPRNCTPGARMPVPPPFPLPPPLLMALQEEMAKVDQGGNSMGEAWEERQAGVRLLQTMCKLLAGVLLRNWYSIKPELYQFLEMLALNESSELEPDLARDCNVALAVLATAIVPLKCLPTAMTSVEKVTRSSSWRARSAMLEFLQVMVFSNLPSFLALPNEANVVMDIVSSLLKDERVEVREKAAKVLGGLLHCSFIPPDQSAKLAEKFKLDISKKLRKKPKAGQSADDFAIQQSAVVLSRHSAVLGLSSFVQASPYDVPDHLPDLLMVLAEHLHDPPPIPATVKRLFQEFKRTHQDNWEEHKENFTEDQLTVLTDLLVSPSYYA